MSDFWLRAVGGEDYVASVHAANARQKLLADVKGSVKSVLAIGLGSRTVLTESSNEAISLCNNVEAVFRYGIRSKSSNERTPRPNSFWYYIEQIPRSMSQYHDGFEVIRSLSEVSTADGRGRAWIRRALNERELASAVEALINNQELTRVYYEDHSLMANFEEATIFLSLLMGVDSVSFRLSYNEKSFDPPVETKPISAIVAKPAAKKTRKAKTKTAMIEGDFSPSAALRDDLSESSTPSFESPITSPQTPMVVSRVVDEGTSTNNNSVPTSPNVINIVNSPNTPSPELPRVTTTTPEINTENVSTISTPSKSSNPIIGILSKLTSNNEPQVYPPAVGEPEEEVNEITTNITENTSSTPAPTTTTQTATPQKVEAMTNDVEKSTSSTATVTSAPAEAPKMDIFAKASGFFDSIMSSKKPIDSPISPRSTSPIPTSPTPTPTPASPPPTGFFEGIFSSSSSSSSTKTNENVIAPLPTSPVPTSVPPSSQSSPPRVSSPGFFESIFSSKSNDIPNPIPRPSTPTSTSAPILTPTPTLTEETKDSSSQHTNTVPSSYESGSPIPSSPIPSAVISPRPSEPSDFISPRAGESDVPISTSPIPTVVEPIPTSPIPSTIISPRTDEQPTNPIPTSPIPSETVSPQPMETTNPIPTSPIPSSVISPRPAESSSDFLSPRDAELTSPIPTSPIPSAVISPRSIPAEQLVSPIPTSPIPASVSPRPVEVVEQNTEREDSTKSPDLQVATSPLVTESRVAEKKSPEMELRLRGSPDRALNTSSDISERTDFALDPVVTNDKDAHESLRFESPRNTESKQSLAENNSVKESPATEESVASDVIPPLTTVVPSVESAISAIGLSVPAVVLSVETSAHVPVTYSVDLSRAQLPAEPYITSPVAFAVPSVVGSPPKVHEELPVVDESKVEEKKPSAKTSEESLANSHVTPVHSETPIIFQSPIETHTKRLETPAKLMDTQPKPTETHPKPTETHSKPKETQFEPITKPTETHFEPFAKPIDTRPEPLPKSGKEGHIPTQQSTGAFAPFHSTTTTTTSAKATITSSPTPTAPSSTTVVRDEFSDPFEHLPPSASPPKKEEPVLTVNTTRNSPFPMESNTDEHPGRGIATSDGFFDYPIHKHSFSLPLPPNREMIISPENARRAKEDTEIAAELDIDEDMDSVQTTIAYHGFESITDQVVNSTNLTPRRRLTTTPPPMTSSNSPPYPVREYTVNKDLQYQPSSSSQQNQQPQDNQRMTKSTSLSSFEDEEEGNKDTKQTDIAYTSFPFHSPFSPNTANTNTNSNPSSPYIPTPTYTSTTSPSAQERRSLPPSKLSQPQPSQPQQSNSQLQTNASQLRPQSLPPPTQSPPTIIITNHGDDNNTNVINKRTHSLQQSGKSHSDSSLTTKPAGGNQLASVFRGAFTKKNNNNGMNNNNNNNNDYNKDYKDYGDEEEEAPDDNGWTPLRKRIYFSIHKNATPKDQDYRCASCGSTFSMGLFSTIRYCEYSGKYYCGKCHIKETYYVPARVLHNWDHRVFPVSNFHKQFLLSVYKEPLFDVSAINPKLYTISKTLPRIRVLRKQLFYLKDFIFTCRERPALMKPLEDKMYLATDVHLYSLRDLVESHELLETLREMVESYFVHIKQCELCKARGSVCEFCKSDKLIFPFQIRNAIQCSGACHGIYHRSCYVKEKCPKCIRIAKRALTNSPPSSPSYKTITE